MDNSNSIPRLEAIFSEVRRAYRLLSVYQRRVMDIMRVIGNMTSRRYEGGWSKFSRCAPKDGKGRLDLWPWDWLNMYLYEFYFGHNTINEDVIGFSVWLVSDSGFYDAESDNGIDIDTFATIEDSITKLVFVAGKNKWHSDFEDFGINMKKDTTEYIRGNGKEIVLAKSFNLSSFTNSDATAEKLKDFIGFCKSNGIPEMTLMNQPSAL